ncbi:alpha/beta hydrolase [Nonomuraea diastatica]|uniref:Peptidase S33 tripeptidyl aminopeptidase-like C-terminal domain-containing protein n=1 Tax=Nonomuraea diastatica TaxID=1848329 RepID=A0A4R4X3U0_9ACTN|nr:alpha/beta hydrolase [Nonomuraea diastatica]TDD24948.1 hypothetical protein E1294_04500 [Nonomuraea diastatica]
MTSNTVFRRTPSTPYEWSANVARQLGHKAVLLTHEGWGHGIYGRTECITTAMDKYLLTLTVPPQGFHCPADQEVGAKAKRQ